MGCYDSPLLEFSVTLSDYDKVCTRLLILKSVARRFSLPQLIAWLNPSTHLSDMCDISKNQLYVQLNYVYSLADVLSVISL